MNILTSFARSLKQAPKPVPLDSQRADQMLPAGQAEPTFPSFKTPLRPGKYSSISPVQKPASVQITLPPLPAPPQMKQKNALGARPAGVLKNKPKSSYLTTEITTKLKEQTLGGERRSPQMTTTKQVVFQPVQTQKATPLLKSNTHYQSHHPSSIKKPPPPPPPSPPQKQLDQTPTEHPLAHAFKGTTQTYRTTLLNTLPPLLRNHTATLAAALTTAHDVSSGYIASHETSLQQLTLPIETSRLVITLDRNTPRQREVETTLEERVGGFQTLVVRREKDLVGLRGRWDAVQGEIEVLRRQIRDADVGEGRGGGGGGYAAEMGSVKGEYLALRGKCLRKFEEGCKRLVEEVEGYEKEYSQKQVQLNQKVLMYIKSMGEVNEEDEVEDGDEYGDEEGDEEE